MNENVKSMWKTSSDKGFAIKSKTDRVLCLTFL